MSKNKHTLLIVDDEANVLKSLKRLFIDTDYKILTAESGEEGLKHFEKRQIHLVISDYRMPSMNGVQFLSKVKELYPETIRIILSGYADVESIVEAINDGQIYKFLSKPWNDQELLTTVQRTFEHFNLQQENTQLLNELKKANDGLRELTKGLEEKVEERTRDLELKNRALETARKILNLLPVGVIGIDSEDVLVYMNQALHNFTNTSKMSLGLTARDRIDNKILQIMKESITTQKTTLLSYKGINDEDIGVVCTPLPDKAGVIALFSFFDIEKYGQISNKKNEKTEALNVR